MGKKKTAVQFSVSKNQKLLMRAALFLAQVFVLLTGCFFRDSSGIVKILRDFFKFPYFSGGAGFVEDFFTSDYGDVSKRVVIVLMYVLLFCVTAVVVERFLHMARQERQFASYIIAALYIISPAAARFLSAPATMSRADVIVLAFALLTLLSAESKRFFLLSPFFILACSLAQKEFIFTYLPVAFIPLIYFRGRSSDGKVIIAINALIAAAVFWAGRTSGYSFAHLTLLRVVQVLTGAVFALPVFAVTFSVWRRAAKKGGADAYIYRLCMASVFLPLPILFVRSCYEAGRIVSAAVICQLLLLFMFVSSREKAVYPSFRAVCEKIEKHAAAALATVGAHAMMTRFNTSFIGFIGTAFNKYFPF
jgi:hypothetical protein